MKRELLENVKVQPYTSGDAIDREGYLSAVLGVSLGAATGTPTGNFIPVEGTVFDLRTPKLMEELSQGAVYNPIMALDGEGGTLREVAEVSIPEKGRSYTLHTTARALQVYNAYNMASFYTSRGLESPFAPAPGLAIEPQNYPNAINIPSMPSPILRPGETYSERQFFAFKW